DMDNGSIFQPGFKQYGKADAPPGGKLDGVAQQVENNLFEAQLIAVYDCGNIRCDLFRDIEMFVADDRQLGVDDIADGMLQGKSGMLQLDHAGFDLGKIEDVVDQG